MKLLPNEDIQYRADREHTGERMIEMDRPLIAIGFGRISKMHYCSLGGDLILHIARSNTLKVTPSICNSHGRQKAERHKGSEGAEFKGKRGEKST